MLLARLFNFFRDMKTLHVFLLEILAVFIGITGSLFVDNWRDEIAEREVLDHLLQETHYNALQDQHFAQRMLNHNQRSIESTLLLTYGDLDELSDKELRDHFERVTMQDWHFQLQPGYERLLNTPLSIPFDNTIAQIDWHFRNLRLQLADLDQIRTRSEDLAYQLARMGELTPNLGRSFYLGMPEDSPEWQKAVTTLLESDGYQRHFADASVLRSALASDDAKALLRDMFKLRYDQQVYAISAGSTLDGIVRTIRRYDPDITLPVESIGLIGSATEFGWERSVTMRPSRDDPNRWSVEVSLIDGEIKFRADDDWSTDWGAPITLGVSDSNPFTFVGDLATVFPRGTAEFKGLNIPVDAGRYRITFNSQSFNYSFERLDHAP